MKDKSFKIYRGGFLSLLVLIAVLDSFSLEGATPKYGYNDDTQTREMKDGIDYLRHELDNHDSEIRMFEERVNNQESTIASLRQQILDANQANKDQLKNATANWDNRIAGLETSNKSLIADFKQLKDHSNSTAEVVAQCKQRIGEMEKAITFQNQNITNLQTAMRSLAEALQTKEGVVEKPSNGKNYLVKSGDTLEKIAKVNGTTVKAIKELNQLASDRIVVGQLLQMP